MKTVHRVFSMGILKCDSEMMLSNEYIEYDGAHFMIGESHKGFVVDKQEDDTPKVLAARVLEKEQEFLVEVMADIVNGKITLR